MCIYKYISTWILPEKKNIPRSHGVASIFCTKIITWSYLQFEHINKLDR